METTIPVFPCTSLDPVLNFYQTLGFEVTYRQETPYIYATIRRGNVELHFNNHGLQVWKSKNAVCLVLVPGVETYHQTFADALRLKYGKIPTAGFPRITRFRKGYTRFHVFDPAGNVLLFIDQQESSKGYRWHKNGDSALIQALHNAEFLRDTYCADEAAAKVLDTALTHYRSAEPIDQARVLAARAELAVAMGDEAGARDFRAQLNQLPISSDDRARFADELQAADELERWQSSQPG
ncbi:MAG: hypothetical protein IT324_03920 [Anaerolineae bacterium]|nr:hypothetical protein [Anaerolineae bacterium]